MVHEIQDAISRLSQEDLDRLREWFIELDASKWDEQFDRDALNGSLDPIADEAIAEFRSASESITGPSPSRFPKDYSGSGLVITPNTTD